MCAHACTHIINKTIRLSRMHEISLEIQVRAQVILCTNSKATVSPSHRNYVNAQTVTVDYGERKQTEEMGVKEQSNYIYES